KPGCGFQELAIFFVVWNDRELAVLTSFDDGEEAGRTLLVLFREGAHPGIEFILGDIIGIKAGLRWFFVRDAVDEGLILFIPRPWALVDHKVVQSLAALRGCVAFKFFL